MMKRVCFEKLRKSGGSVFEGEEEWFLGEDLGKNECWMHVGENVQSSNARGRVCVKEVYYYLFSLNVV